MLQLGKAYDSIYGRVLILRNNDKKIWKEVVKTINPDRRITKDCSGYIAIRISDHMLIDLFESEVHKDKIITIDGKKIKISEDSFEKLKRSLLDDR